MKATAILADDEPLLREDLRDKLLACWPRLDILEEAPNGIAASEAIARLRPDVAFLDIRMPGRTGLEVAQGIEGPTRVVFITAYDGFAVQAFERAAVDYILKPIETARLARAVERVQASLARPGAEGHLAQLLAELAARRAPAAAAPPRLRWVRASRGDTTFQIPIDEVLYFQSDDKVTLVQTPRGEHVIRTSLVELLPQLDPDRFWQIHRSTVIQVDCVRSSRRTGDGRMTVTLEGVEAPLAVSRAYQALFRQM